MGNEVPTTIQTLLVGLPTSWPWLSVGIFIAMGCYALMRCVDKHHLSKDFKEELSLWLLGAHESGWSKFFCHLFDVIFGDKHLSWRCFYRSSLASMGAVLLLYIVFDEGLGVYGNRQPDGVDIPQLLLLGATINILADYGSLYETRWLLQRLERVKSFWGQGLVLLADLLFSGIIIWLVISGYRLIVGQEPITVVEMLALFSVFSIFFYSTFLTSLWAWSYCLSTWVMRLFARTPLRKILAIEETPAKQIGLVVAGLVLSIFFVTSPLAHSFKTEEGAYTTPFDEWLCQHWDSKICGHIVRLTPEEERTFKILSQACSGGVLQYCIQAGLDKYGIDNQQAVALFRKACHGGEAQGCTNLGWMYEKGREVVQDEAKAVTLYQQGCDGGNARGCTNLGWMYAEGREVVQDEAKAVTLYQQGCDGGNAQGCTNLGIMYAEGREVVQDEAKAVTLYQQGCDGGNAQGCTNLGIMYEKGTGVAQDEAKAVTLYQKSCDGGEAQGCAYLETKLKRGAPKDQ